MAVRREDFICLNVVASGGLRGKTKGFKGKGKGVVEGKERMSAINVHGTRV